jgi:hypothetical protein
MPQELDENVESISTETPEAISAPTESRSEEKDKPLGDAGERALRAERQRAQQLEKELKKFKNVDPAKYQELLTLQQQIEQEKEQKAAAELEQRTQYDEALRLKDQKFNQEKQSLQQQISELEKQISQRDEMIAADKISIAFMAAFDGADGYLEDAEILIESPKIKSQLRYNESTRTVEVIDPVTNTPLTDGKGKFMTVSKWMSEIVRPAHGRFFKPLNTNSGGGSAPPRQSSTATITDGKLNAAALAQRARAKK